MCQKSRPTVTVFVASSQCGSVTIVLKPRLKEINLLIYGLFLPRSLQMRQSCSFINAPAFPRLQAFYVNNLFFCDPEKEGLRKQCRPVVNPCKFECIVARRAQRSGITTGLFSSSRTDMCSMLLHGVLQYCGSQYLNLTFSSAQLCVR